LASSGGLSSIGTLESPITSDGRTGVETARNAFNQAVIHSE